MPEGKHIKQLADSEPSELSGDVDLTPESLADAYDDDLTPESPADAGEPTPESSTGEDEPTPESPGGRMFSAYGIASAALGALCVVAIALGVVIWSTHHSDVGEYHYRTRAMRAAAEWTSVLINMNKDNVDASMQRLHDETVGQLNAEFDTTVQPYRKVVQQLQSRSIGRIESVAIQSVHHELDTQTGAQLPAPEPPPPDVASRTDTVMVVATSVSGNAAGKPQKVYWNLRLDVSSVDGKLLISRMGSIR